MTKHLRLLQTPALALLALASPLAVPHLHAQYENGSIVGTIRDASGAPVAGAHIKAANVSTGICDRGGDK